jgi:hypothetical protein
MHTSYHLHPTAGDKADDPHADVPGWGHIAASLLTDPSHAQSSARRDDPPGAPSPADAVYHGWWRPDGQAATVVEDQPGVYRPLPHLIRHSPAGMAWGYIGNGPRDLARSLLADALGSYAVCPACTEAATRPNHTGQVSSGDSSSQAVPRTRRNTVCPNRCDAGVLPLPYLRFTEQIVARLPQDGAWSLRRIDILHWLAGPGHQTPPPVEPHDATPAEPAQRRTPRRRRRPARSRGQRP